MENIGETIKELRMRKGISLRGMSVACGVSLSTLSKIENAPSNPTVKTIAAVVQVLGMSPSDFFVYMETGQWPAELVA